MLQKTINNCLKVLDFLKCWQKEIKKVKDGFGIELCTAASNVVPDVPNPLW